MAFHRLTVPVYAGGLRGGDDYINNAIAGTPAPADTALGAGTYTGSYFFAPGELVTGASINRGFKALAQNNDFLDDAVVDLTIDLAAMGVAAAAFASARGLNSVYRHASASEAGGLDTPGAGATYFRDGPGIAGYSQRNITGSTSYTASIGYQLEALWLADNRDFGAAAAPGSPSPFGPAVVPGPDRVGGMSSGFVYLGHQRQTYTPDESATNRAPGFASFYHGAKRYDDGAPNSVLNAWLPAGTGVTFAGNIAVVTSPAYFYSTINGSSSIAFGYDLLELDFGDGVPRAFIMYLRDGATGCQLRNLDGSIPAFGGATATIVRWVRTRFGVFDGARELREGYEQQGTEYYGLGGLVHSTGAPGGSDASLEGMPAQFYGTDSRNALVWGGWDAAACTYTQLGLLTASGGVAATSLFVSGPAVARVHTTQSQTLTSGGITKTVDFALGGNAVWGTPAGSGVTLTVTVSTNGINGKLFINRGADAFTTLAVLSPAHSSVRIKSGDTALGAASTHTVYAFETVGTILYVWKIGNF